MAARRHSNPSRPEPVALHPDPAEAPVWLTLTDLGRIYGISAMHCGRLLSEAGLRDLEGHPTDRAVQIGCASPGQQHHGGQPFWHRQQCSSAFEAAGLVTVRRATLVQQWVDLLSALAVGSPAISTSAAQMAEEMPADLLEPVNRQLRQLGCSFQVQSGRPVSRAAATSAARREPPAGAAAAPLARPGRRPPAHGASG
ncbi:MAG: hypothetical protein ACO262_03615 [Vulcanococcus sp.]